MTTAVVVVPVLVSETANPKTKTKATSNTNTPAGITSITVPTRNANEINLPIPINYRYDAQASQKYALGGASSPHNMNNGTFVLPPPDSQMVGGPPVGGTTWGWTIPDNYADYGTRTVMLDYNNHQCSKSGTPYAVDLSVFNSPNDFIPVYSTLNGTVIEALGSDPATQIKAPDCTAGSSKNCDGYGNFVRIRNTRWASVNAVKLFTDTNVCPVGKRLPTYDSVKDQRCMTGLYTDDNCPIKCIENPAPLTKTCPGVATNDVSGCLPKGCPANSEPYLDEDSLNHFCTTTWTTPLPPIPAVPTTTCTLMYCYETKYNPTYSNQYTSCMTGMQPGEFRNQVISDKCGYDSQGAAIPAKSGKPDPTCNGIKGDKQYVDMANVHIANYDVVIAHLTSGSMTGLTADAKTFVPGVFTPGYGDQLKVKDITNWSQIGTMGASGYYWDGGKNQYVSNTQTPMVHYEVWRNNACDAKLSSPTTNMVVVNPATFIGQKTSSLVHQNSPPDLTLGYDNKDAAKYPTCSDWMTAIKTKVQQQTPQIIQCRHAALLFRAIILTRDLAAYPSSINKQYDPQLYFELETKTDANTLGTGTFILGNPDFGKSMPASHNMWITVEGDNKFGPFDGGAGPVDLVGGKKNLLMSFGIDGAQTLPDGKIDFIDCPSEMQTVTFGNIPTYKMEDISTLKTNFAFMPDLCLGKDNVDANPYGRQVIPSEQETGKTGADAICTQPSTASTCPAGPTVSAFVSDNNACGQTLDLLPYMQGTSGLQITMADKEVLSYTQATPLNAKNRFFMVKNTIGDNFEEFTYDNDWIYHVRDTTATEGFNGPPIKCIDVAHAGQDAIFDSITGQFGNGCSAFNSNSALEGSPFRPRNMQVCSTSAEMANTIIGFGKDSCTCCETKYSGANTNQIKLVDKGTLKLSAGSSYSDVIEVANIKGAGSGETFFYQKNVGLIGYGTGNTVDPTQIVPPTQLTCVNFVTSTTKGSVPNVVDKCIGKPAGNPLR